jgi:hypothetical protein
LMSNPGVGAPAGDRQGRKALHTIRQSAPNR